jgi:hypothetical protein
MNVQTITMIKSGLISGIVFAALMAGFDYSNGQDFRIWRFLYNTLFFGIFMAFLTRYNLKKPSRN